MGIAADSNVKKKTQTKFGGLCRERMADGEAISYMVNTTSCDHPRISARERRKLSSVRAVAGSMPYNVAVSDKVYVVESDKLYISENGSRTECCTLYSESDKRIVCYDKDLIIIPDYIHYNGAFGYTTKMRISTDVIKATISGNSLVADSVDLENIGFRMGDGITVTSVASTLSSYVFTLNSTVYFVDGKALYIDGTFPRDGEYMLRVRRDMPSLTHAVCMGSRMYGTSGANVNISEEGNIYNWKGKRGLDTDPVTLPSASVGSFTACAEWNGYIIFFKENSICKLLGGKASNYVLSEVTAPGIPEGGHKTLVSLGGSLYYCGTMGVYKYDGTHPKRIDQGALPDGLKATAAATDGERYYLAANGNIYVYDPIRQIWSAESSGTIVSMAGRAGEVYMLTSGGLLFASGSTAEGELEDATDARLSFGYDDGGAAEKKSLLSLSLTAFLEFGTNFEVLAEFDEDGEQVLIGSSTGRGAWENLTYMCPPNICSGFRIHIHSYGDFTLASLTRSYRIIG